MLDKHAIARIKQPPHQQLKQLLYESSPPLLLSGWVVQPNYNHHMLMSRCSFTISELQQSMLLPTQQGLGGARPRYGGCRTVPVPALMMMKAHAGMFMRAL